MGILRVMTAGGDRAVKWDPRRAEAGDPEARAAILEAERVFAEARARGATAFVVTTDQPARRIDRFDPEAEQIVVVPRVAGG
jgi:hypothetical protein